VDSPPYQLRQEDQFVADAALIHPDLEVVERALEALKIALERRPEIFPMFDDARRLRYAHILFHLSSGPSVVRVEPLIVTFRIEAPPPNGLVSLRRVISEKDLRGGLHIGTDDLPPADDISEDYSWS
jgi:hypothetical protein